MSIMWQARAFQIGAMAAIAFYVIVLVILPEHMHSSAVDSDLTPVISAAALILAVLFIAFGYFVPRWAAGSIMRQRTASQREGLLLHVQVMRSSLFEVPAMLGMVLGFLSAGWAIVAPLMVLSATPLILTFPTEAKWRRMLG